MNKAAARLSRRLFDAANDYIKAADRVDKIIADGDAENIRRDHPGAESALNVSYRRLHDVVYEIRKFKQELEDS